VSRSAWVVVVGAVVWVSAACSGSPTAEGARAGTVMLYLTTPQSDDGAVMFEVIGPPIEGATTADASMRLFTRRSDDGTIVGVVVGVVANGALVRLQVPDVGARAQYVARVIEVADRQNALRSSLRGYALTLTP
jgi:hypothetical protein